MNGRESQDGWLATDERIDMDESYLITSGLDFLFRRDPHGRKRFGFYLAAFVGITG